MLTGRVLCPVTVMVVGLLSGCGEDKPLSQKAGSAISGTAASFVSGLSEGVDKQMALELQIDPAFANQGLTVTLGKSRGLGSKSAAVYVIAAKPYKGSIIARALDSAGSEIGRSIVEVDFSADDADYVNFTFNEQMDSQMVRSYSLSLR